MAFVPSSSLSGGGGGGGVVEQGARDGTAQAWYVDNAPADTLDVNVAQPLQVVGNVPAFGADSGNPLKVGAIYTAAAPGPYTNGQRTNLRSDSGGGIYTVLKSADSGNTPSYIQGSDNVTTQVGLYTVAANEVYDEPATTWRRLRAATADALSGVSAGGVPAAGVMLYDPTAGTLNRARGDTTNGLYVQLRGDALDKLQAIIDALSDVALTAIMQRERLEIEGV